MLQFDIGQKPLAGFNALDRVFVQIQSVQLQPIRQRPLRNVDFLAQTRNIYTANIVASVCRFIDEQKSPSKIFRLFDIYCLSTRKLYAIIKKK